ncbi:hypothetical protein DTO207G8_4507 [Paecilomyces variotii]|nr:hypothetical protein DTO207G8_4507 [Paecilomyces variotii]
MKFIDREREREKGERAWRGEILNRSPSTGALAPSAFFPAQILSSTHPSVPSATTQNSPGSLSLCMTVVDNRSFTRLP